MVRYGPFLLVITALISGCIPSPDASRVPKKRASAALPNNAELRQCTSELSRLGARYTILPDRYSGSCNAVNSVQLASVGVPVTNLTATQCPLARAFALWARGTVQQAARRSFGESVARIETMGSYSCRQVKGVASGKLSQHAFANAIDVSAFVLTNGRRVAVEGGWSGNEEDRAFLRSVRDGACRTFLTVLSPDFNAAHYNHLHFDLDQKQRRIGSYCR
jgi:hypothetical protein